MPELPDVEVFRRYMAATALHKKIENVRVKADRVMQGVSARRLSSALKGQQFRRTDRHGKYLFAELTSDKFLLLHFGMTGFLKYFKVEDEKPDHVKLLIDFANDYHLAYDNQRKLGRVSLIDDRDRFVSSQGLGPDPLDDDFDSATFDSIMKGRRGSIKSALMNQQILAGIGNIYSDEILYQAGIRPDSSAAKLNAKDRLKTFNAMLRVLRVAIRHKADPEKLPGSYLILSREAGRRCSKCGGEIKKATISGRSAYYCGRHQRLIT